jgi:D-2-hydroxyacid dehydrogenase (NADP+)
MKKRLKLIVNVTRDRRVHEILENSIAGNNVVSGMFERRYVMSREELLAEAALAEVFFTFALPEEAVKAANNLRWVHFASAGVEKSLNQTLLARTKVKLSGSTGIHAAAISEYVLMMMLAFSKGLRNAYRFQDKHEWHFEALSAGKFDLEGKTVGIIGLGSIGLRVARLSKAFGIKVIGTVNRPRRLPYVDKVYPPSRLDDLLGRADFVILAVPLTDMTFHLIGEHELSIMKPGSYLINIGRGRLVDEKALIVALQQMKIAGAALDVFEKEPLPADSPLWEMEQVSVTPHYSGMAENLWEKVAQRFCENAIRFKQGRRLVGIVNRKKGY